MDMRCGKEGFSFVDAAAVSLLQHSRRHFLLIWVGLKAPQTNVSECCYRMATSTRLWSYGASSCAWDGILKLSYIRAVLLGAALQLRDSTSDMEKHQAMMNTLEHNAFCYEKS